MPALRTLGETAFFFDVVNNADIYYEYAGTAAPVQLERKPVFHANLGYMLDRDLRHPEIVRLKVKNNRREARLTWSSGDMLAFYSKAVPVSFSLGSDGIYTITPQTDLEPGEYLLSLGHEMMKYDFSVK